MLGWMGLNRHKTSEKRWVSKSQGGFGQNVKEKSGAFLFYLKAKGIIVV